jgi:hypothetical protein
LISAALDPAPDPAAPASSAAKSTTPAAEHPASLGVAPRRRVVTTNVEVHGIPVPGDTNEGYERHITPEEVEQSAGTFGDPGRFMQLLPGVVSDNDQRNDFIVRGGNPAETSFLIDNIQMPSINQLALSDTTGGFVSMIDNVAVKSTVLHTDAYDSKFDQRLSAVVEISTRPQGPVGHHVSTQFGIGGTGFTVERPLDHFGSDGSMFVSFRRSVLNLFTDDIGMNGVPIYTNSLVRADNRIDDRNNWWGLSLTGVDQMKIHPSEGDTAETAPFNIQYSGWRNTTGINWQHIYSARSLGILSFSNSEQAQTINQTGQLLDYQKVYYEDSHDGITTAKYDWTFQPRKPILASAGMLASVDRMNYVLQQPLTIPNPYSVDPQVGSPMSFNRHFMTGSSAAYAQAAVSLPHSMKLVVGERVSQWALLGTAVATPKAVIFVPIRKTGIVFHAGVAQYAQLPPSLYVLSYSNRQELTAIHSTHYTVGANLVNNSTLRITLNAYEKRYRDYPIAVDFPRLTMANIADTFGEAFLMFPMASKGTGIARGVENAIDYRPFRRLTVASTLTYMRTWYSGLDGVLRKGNFDIPVVLNVSGNAIFSKHWTGSFRYSAATGKPYTPDDQAQSFTQNRDVYDISKLNSLRAPMYSRLDFRAEWSHPVHEGSLKVHVGLENALWSTNFYSFLWRPRCPDCGVEQQNQMPLFPEFGVKFQR